MTKTMYNSIKHHLHREKKVQLTMSGLSLRFQVESHTGCMHTEGGKLNWTKRKSFGFSLVLFSSIKYM